MALDIKNYDPAQMYGAVASLGATAYTGAVTMASTLDVTGAVTMGSSLAVTGALSAGATAVGTLLNKDLTEVVAATNVIAASESGSVFFLNHATEFVSTLPAVAAGLHFTFIVTGAPSGADYTVVTASSANIMVGHVLTSQDAGGTADSEVSGGDTLSFVSAKAVIGDQAEFWCDGTNWIVRASSKVFDAITITTAG